MVTGEPSGDRQAAALARELAARVPGIRLRGIGGAQMAAAGVEVVSDSSTWSAIGVGDSLRKVMRLAPRLSELNRMLRADPPDVFVPVDFGTFNVRLASALFGSGIPVLYYFPPRSWSRRRWGGPLNRVVDVIAAPFPWCVETMAGGKARVEWVGHPLVDQVKPTLAPAEAARKYGLDRERPIVAIIPGSRESEIRNMFPAMAEAAVMLQERFPGTQIMLPVAPSVDRDRLEAGLQEVGVEALLLAGTDYDALQLATVAAATSGTVTLELALLGVPAVVLYRVSHLSVLQFHIAQRLYGPIPFIAMPNIVADRRVYTEFLQASVYPELIAHEVGRFLAEPDLRQRCRQGLRLVRERLGPPGATARTAALVLELAGMVSGRQCQGEGSGGARGQ